LKDRVLEFVLSEVVWLLIIGLYDLACSFYSSSEQNFKDLSLLFLGANTLNGKKI